ncbi:MAG: hypothetical protein AAFY15_06060 [Cyanobacteria bacterium J06648_11]
MTGPGLTSDQGVRRCDGTLRVYLVPSFEGEDPADTLLKRHWREVFESMLEGWLVDESGWPERRSLAMFKEWFEVDAGTVIDELEKASTDPPSASTLHLDAPPHIRRSLLASESSCQTPIYV